MEYVYASLLLHTAGKDINEGNIGSILKSVGINVDQAQAKSIVAALDNVNIEEALKTSAFPVAAPASAAPAAAAAPKKEEKEEEKKEEEIGGLGALFG